MARMPPGGSPPSSPPTAGPALTAILARQRERLNARVTLARREHAALDPNLLKVRLVAWLDPVATALAAAPQSSPDALDRVVEALLEVILQIQRRQPLAQQPELLEGMWRELLPRLPGPLLQAPQRVAGALINALHHLAATPGARPGEWLGLLERQAPRLGETATLLDLGVVAGWRCGLAHTRPAALGAARRLPLPLLSALWDLPDSLDEAAREELLAALEQDPWRDPAHPAAAPGLRLAGITGGFRGFGGPFLRPPRVWRDPDGILASDGEGSWTIHADRWGITLRPAGPERRPPAPSRQRHGTPFRLSGEGTVQRGGVQGQWPGLAGAASWAGDASTLVVALPHSHRLRVIAWEGGG